MSLARLLSQRCEVVTYGETGTDQLGNTIRGETGRYEYPCRLWLVDSVERTGTADVVDAWQAILPPEAAAVVSAGARLEAEGRVFEVRGTPDVKRTPRGVSHVSVTLRFVEEET